MVSMKCLVWTKSTLTASRVDMQIRRDVDVPLLARAREVIDSEFLEPGRTSDVKGELDDNAVSGNTKDSLDCKILPPHSVDLETRYIGASRSYIDQCWRPCS